MSGKIFIPKPCHENWNKMSPEEKGRHCAVCSKVVKDFTAMKTNEIIDVLKETEGEVCGRINIKEITPTNKKQKVYFLINGWLYRKAIYPVMALLGFTLVSKKISAQTDYPLKGKVAYNDYHVNSKKITLVVKSHDGNRVISGSVVNIVNGTTHPITSQSTDSNGKTTFDLKANDLVGDAIEVEIYSPGFELKKATIKLIKDVQTVEIRMEEDIMIMGEMMYVPQNEIKPDIREKNNARDSSKKIEITKCSILDIRKLPSISEEIIDVEPMVDMVDSTQEETLVPKQNLDANILQSNFDIYPVPASDFVNITTTQTENFNLDLFDANGKKVQSIINGNSRYTLDVTTYTNGIYYILITVGGKAVETKKILVTR